MNPNYSDIFYRAALCLSAVLLSLGVRPFVRLSVTFLYYIQRAEDIVKFFLGPVAPSF